MGGCASKPKDLATTEKAPAPVEAPTPLVKTLEKVEPETAASAPAPQETNDVDETKDKPVVEASEPDTKAEEAEAEAKPVAKVEEAEAKPAAEPAVKADEPKEAMVEGKAEEKKEVAETVATA